MLKDLTSAIAFLTLLPVDRSTPFHPEKMVPWFPVVGLIIGALVSILDQIALFLWPPQVVAVIDVAALVLITGAFHLDGLADASDGMLGHRGRERVLEIMKDSRIGVMGACALVVCLAVKWGGLSAMGPERTLAILVIPAFSRSAMLFGMKFLPYGRNQGTGHAFFGDALFFRSFAWISVPLIASLFLGLTGLGIILFFVLVTTAMILWYHKRMGCITGDMMGAMCETTEAVLFLAASAGGGMI